MGQFFLNVHQISSKFLCRTVKMLGIREVTGGSLNDSQLINGVAFKKAFSYAGTYL